MFTKEELELIQVAIIAYEQEHREAFERQKAKGKRGLRMAFVYHRKIH